MRVTQRSDERGAVAVMIAILSLVLIICIAFAVDLGYAWQVRRSMVKATDAAALAAAHEARDWYRASALNKSTGNCSDVPAVNSAASGALAANRSDAAMDWCFLGDSSGPENGVVTVRGSTDAQLSFSGVIGRNSLGVSSSTSVAWHQPKVLPIAICADAVGNNDLAKWVEDPSSPTGDRTLRASASTNSTLCSSGGSGAWAAIDLGKSVTSYSAFNECRPIEQGTTPKTKVWENTWLDLFNGNFGTIAPQVGSYYCATVGTPTEFDATPRTVDSVLCGLPKGTDVVVPLITERPNSDTGNGAGKNWIAKLGGYAVATFDGYSGILNKQDLCDQFHAAGPQLHRRSHSRRRFELARSVSRRRVRPQAVESGFANVSSLTATPNPATLGSGGTANVTITATVTNSSSSRLTDGHVRITYPSSPTASGFSFSGSNATCSAVAAQTLDCVLKQNVAANGGTESLTFSATFSADGQLSARLTSATLTNVSPNAATLLVTVQSGGGSGGSGNTSIGVKFAGLGTGTVDFGRSNLSPCSSDCVVSFQGNKSVDITAIPTPSGSQFIAWSGCDTVTANVCTVSTNRNPIVTVQFEKYPTLTVTLAGTGRGTVTASDGRLSCITDSACNPVLYPAGGTVTLTAASANGSIFAGWTGDCSGTSVTCTVNLTTVKYPVITATFNDATANGGQDFRDLTLNFSAVYRTPGLIITDVTAYRICATDVKTRTAAGTACTKP